MGGWGRAWVVRGWAVGHFAASFSTTHHHHSSLPTPTAAAYPQAAFARDHQQQQSQQQQQQQPPPPPQEGGLLEEGLHGPSSGRHCVLVASGSRITTRTCVRACVHASARACPNACNLGRGRTPPPHTSLGLHRQVLGWTLQQQWRRPVVATPRPAT